MRVLGVDPGINGGLAVLEFDPAAPEANPGIVDVIDVPIIGEGSAKEVNVIAYRDWLRRTNPDRAFVEHVQPMPSREETDPETGERKERRGMGATSAFNYGGCVKTLRAIPWAMDIPITMVSAQKWRGLYGLKGGAGAKETSRQYALHRFPQATYLLARMRDHQRAESLLIANFGRVLITGRMPRPIAAMREAMARDDLFGSGGR